MRTEPLPLDALRSVAERGCTGEFICASPTVEVHVYLQRGRIAWATDSEHPFVFTRQLQKTAQIDPESFRDILDSCRREKRPLGETLVSWGVATWDEVKDALRHQIELALDVLHHGGPAQTLFLDRTEQFAQYESGLTFDLAELLGDRDAAHAPSQGSEAPRPSDGSMSIPEGTRSVGPVSLPSGGQHARRLLDAVDGMLWAEHLEGTTVIEAAPEPSERPRFAPEIVERTVLDGAEVVALRAPEGTLAGALLSSSSSLWCRLTPEATVGLAISALAAFTGTGTPASDSTNAHLERGPVWVIGGDTPITTALQDFLGRAPETLATLLTDVDNGGWSCGAGGALAPEYALEIVRRRAHVLAARTPFPAAARPEDSDDVGFRFRTLVTRERSVWCFGAELGTRPRTILWLLLHRRSSQGLGWAYLTSLSRQLMHLRGRRSG